MTSLTITITIAIDEEVLEDLGRNADLYTFLIRSDVMQD